MLNGRRLEGGQIGAVLGRGIGLARLDLGLMRVVAFGAGA
jgi:hypothetical protein